jgi:hypothetical protein
MPKRLLISETGVSVSEYRRVTSRSCWSVSLRRVPAVPSLLEVSPSEPDPDAVDRDVSLVVSMNLSNLSIESYSMRETTATPDVKKNSSALDDHRHARTAQKDSLMRAVGGGPARLT